MTITEALAALGDTADAVAASLAARDACGLRRDLAGCPVWQYLLDQAVIGPEARVHLFRVEFNDGIRDPHELPEPVVAFSENFDAGDYPYLDLSAGDGDEPTDILVFPASL